MKHVIGLVGLLTLALAAGACGDDSDTGGDTGGTGGSSATGGTGGSGGGSAGCEAICDNECIGEISNEDFETCVEQCGTLFAGCDSETLAFLDCLDSVDCDEDAAANQCQSEALAWTTCIQDIGLPF